MDLRSNLSKARGLGSAHEGASHWWIQRITAIALIPLVIWFVVSVIKATSIHGIDGVIYLLSSPFNAITMILFLGTAVYHGTLGIKVIIEDYVHCICVLKSMDIFIKFTAVISIVAVTFAILSVHIRTYENPAKFQAGFWSSKNSASKLDDTTDALEKLEEYERPAKESAPALEIETPK